jgi:uncharacterized membrane protein
VSDDPDPGRVAHSHGDLGDPHPELGPVSPHVRTALAFLGALVVIGCVLGLVATWPSDPIEAGEGFAIDRVEATVVSLEVCEGGEGECLQAVAELEDGTEVVVQVPSASQAGAVDVGQDVVLGYSDELPAGNQYSFLEADRSTPVTALVVVFAVAVILLSGWRGAASLLSLALTLLVIGIYVLPALRDGSSPLLVALVTAGVVMLITMYASYGISVRSTVALVGTLLGLALAALVGRVVTAAASFTGLDETTRFLETLVGSVDTRGLLLAGLIIGALGVLDDVTVTQTATVWELAAADPDAPRRSLFAAGMRVGRAHVSATVNTLVLAYVGASLPLLLYISALGTSWTDAVFSESVATEIVRGLAGSLGIVAAVPLTTALACWAVPRPISSPR